MRRYSRGPAARLDWFGRLCGMILILVAAACAGSPGAPSLPPSPSPVEPILSTATISATAALPATLPPTPPEPSPTFEPSPRPTVDNQAPTAEPTCAPTECAALTPLPPAIETPGPVPTLSGKLPLAQVRILRPGQLSKVTSPLTLETSVIPGANGIVRIELLGEDARVIAREVIGFATPRGQRVGIVQQIDFEIGGVAEAARLQVTVDDGFDRPIAVSSVDLILLSVGQADLFPSGDLIDPYVIVSPRPEQAISGGTLSVSGFIRPVNDRPIFIQLVDSQGKIIATRQLSVPPNEEGTHQPFQTEIPYAIQAPEWARLVVRQSGARILGDAALSSRLVYLEP